MNEDNYEKDKEEIGGKRRGQEGKVQTRKIASPYEKEEGKEDERKNEDEEEDFIDKRKGEKVFY
ncbi:hypothetical protein E2C01_037931 [Portunus trituberculatus]|uniref:Uncharacterized protein n=1 Tax=Portunus trituberculatus TaxID=210409 RepID=A0A5B7FCT6_PORTR|nr:hypothetical protein [Portunus trituberculatus]